MMKAKPILLIFLLMFVCSCSSNKVLQESSTVVPPVTKKPTSTLPPTVIKLDTSTPTSVETKTPVPSKTPTSTETAVDYNALPPLRELVINESDFEDKDFDFSFYLQVGFQIDDSVPVDVTSEIIKDCEIDCAKFHWGYGRLTLSMYHYGSSETAHRILEENWNEYIRDEYRHIECDSLDQKEDTQWIGILLPKKSHVIFKLFAIQGPILITFEYPFTVSGRDLDAGNICLDIENLSNIQLQKIENAAKGIN